MGADHICAHCFSKKFFGYRKKLAEPFEHNYHYLNEHDMTLEEAAAVPINTFYCRIESMGEIGSVRHAINCLKIIDTHPLVNFGWWTKEWSMLKEALVRFGHKPTNLSIVLSMPKIGKEPPKGSKGLLKIRYCADHVFTVFPKDTPEEQINCGGRRCIDCLMCYKKDTEFYIRERLK